MIVKENGLSYAKLIHVSVDNGKTDNSNKVYIMEETADGRIKCEYGRVGKSLVTEWKPASKWQSVYNQKTGKSKGYEDVTEYQSEPVVDSNAVAPDNKVSAISDKVVRKLIEELMAYANHSIKQNYKVSQDAVSEKQVDAAQEIIDKISGLIKVNVNIKDVNDLLLKLYTVIPRKMDNVKNYLLTEIKDKNGLTDAQRVIDNEQSMLDTMSGQVQLIKKQKEVAKQAAEDKADGKVTNITILDEMGISVEVENDKDTLALITKLLGSNAHQCKKVFKVTNHKTQSKFDAHMKKATEKKKRMYWHGSRNENWFNITQTGLLIRPSGAVHTGSMFGDGIYFGYTSLKGSYWARGGDNKAYLALFEVHLGKQKEITQHDTSCYGLCEKVLKKDGYDSVFAKGGYDLRNNEFIVYNSAQCTITHLIEIGD